MANNSKFLGWELTFKDKTNNLKFDTEIVDLNINVNNDKCIPTVSIKFLVDSSIAAKLLNEHEGTLTVINKMLLTNQPSEIFTIDLISKSNVSVIDQRKKDSTDNNNWPIVITYMCKYSVDIINSYVGKDWQKGTTLETIVRDLYKQTNTSLKLSLDKFQNNTSEPNGNNGVLVIGTQFINAIRYLNQHYGFYDSYLFMFGDTFTDKNKSWVITSCNELIKKREKINVDYLPYNNSGSKNVEENIYYDYHDIFINNNYSTIKSFINENPMYLYVDSTKFLKGKSRKTRSTLNGLRASSTSKQYNSLNKGKQIFFGSRLDSNEYTVKEQLQLLGLSAYRINNLLVPNPFLLKHFKLGTVIKFKSKTNAFINTDINLLVVNFNLHIMQGDGTSGGSTYNSNLYVDVCALSPQ